MDKFFEHVADEVTRLGRWLHRRPGDDRAFEDRRVIFGKLALIGALFGVGIALFGNYCSKS